MVMAQTTDQTAARLQEKNAARLQEANTFIDALFMEKIQDEFAFEKYCFCLCTCDGWTKPTQTKKGKAKNFKALGFFSDPDKLKEAVKAHLDKDLWIQVCLNDGKDRTREHATQAPGFWVELDHKNLQDPADMMKAIKDVQPIKPTMLVDSGNGCHGYFCFNEMLDVSKIKNQDAFDLFHNRLRRIIEKTARPFLKDNTSLDSIQDRARVLRIPGTFNNKDAANPKPVKILWHDPDARHDAELLFKQINEEYSKLNISAAQAPLNGTAPAPVKSQAAGQPISKSALAKQIMPKLDPAFMQNPTCFKYLTDKHTALVEHLQENKPGFSETWDRSKIFKSDSEYDQSIANYAFNHGCDYQQIFELIIFHRIIHNAPVKTNNLQSFAQTISEAELKAPAWAKQQPGGLGLTVDQLEKALEKDQEGIAQLFVELSDGNFYYDPVQVIQAEKEAWWIWDKHKYIPDVTGKRFRLISKILDEFVKLERHYIKQMVKAQAADDKKEADKYSKKLTALRGRIKSYRDIDKQDKIAKNAISKHDEILQYEWDKDICKLPCTNGYYDLEKDVFIPKPDKELLNRKSTNIAYDPNADCPLFKKTINDNFGHHKGMERYIQKLFGYAAAGDPKENLLAVLYGPGGQNGKESVLNGYINAMGDYAHTGNQSLLMENKFKKQAGANTPERASLPGIRDLIIPETGKGKIDYAQACNFSGQGFIPSIGKWQKTERRFKPNFTIFINTNNRPWADKDCKAYWKRAHIIKFEIEYITRSEWENLETKGELKWFHRKRDKDITNRISKEELPGILNYLIEGYRLYKKEGLKQPKFAQEQKNLYQNMSDGLEKFMDYGTVSFDENYQAAIADVFSLYTAFCEKTQVKEPIGSTAKFSKEVSKRFADKLGKPTVKQARPNTGTMAKDTKSYKCFIGLQIEND